MAFPTNEASSSNDCAAIDNIEKAANEISGEETHELLNAREDRYGGVEVDIENMDNDVLRFASSLKASLSQWARQVRPFFVPYMNSSLNVKEKKS